MNTQEANLLTSSPEVSALQPLREIGSITKSQYWDFEDISRALREARRLGIAPERRFGHSLAEDLAQAG